jgi:hypothetical protein
VGALKIEAAGGALGAGELDGGALGAGAPELAKDEFAGCDGDPANGVFIARNIAVKLPGSLAAALGAGAGTGAGAANGAGSGRFSGATAGNGAGVWPEAAIFSIGTGLKTFASSSEGRGALGSGVLSAWSIRVKSPCPAAGAAAGCAVGATGAKDSGAA